MKKLLLIFGILDLIAFARIIPSIPGLQHYPALYLTIMIPLGVSLIFSGYFLITSKPIGFWIYYIQFPFRLIAMAGLSFGFLFYLLKLVHNEKVVSLIIGVICILLEIARLIFTIIIHKRHLKLTPVNA